MRDEIKKVKRELRLYQLVLKDGRTPLHAKLLLGLAVGYILTPIDAIPDFIPLLGQLDDMLIVPALAYAALKLVPPHIIEDCRKKL